MKNPNDLPCFIVDDELKPIVDVIVAYELYKLIGDLPPDDTEYQPMTQKEKDIWFKKELKRIFAKK